ncbi:MAG: VOC family protein [Bryobacteraceae bacterium]|jgi:catechol 2,3-dioxygenase-like lactoylglutathione lyase family enzyme
MRTTLLLTRRAALATLTAGALATRTALSANAPFRFGSLDHLALAVDDTEKSVHFYTRLFGNTVLKEKTNPRHYVKLGPNYVAMATAGQGQPLRVINHFCPGIVNFDLAAAKRALDQMGIQYREATGVGLFVPDPDGTLVQLWTENSWNHLGETAAPVAIPSQGEPLLRPTGIDHILVNVSNVEKSTAFYEKILGPVINPASRPRRTWFNGGGGNRVGLALAGPGEKLGIDHYCLTAPFDRTSLTKAVEAAGAKIIQGDLPAGIDFLDVDGIHLQIIPPPARV